MANFQLKIDIEPKDIPSLDDSHKQDCADSINRAINSTFKYTMIFSFAVIGVYAVYTFFGLVYVLRMQTTLPNIPPALPAIAILIVIFEFIAGTMKRWAIFTEIFLHIVLIIFSLTGLQSVLAAPFAFYGIILHTKLLSLVPYYDVISNLKGYPDFTPLPIGDVVKKADAAEEKSSGNQENASPAKPEEPVEQPVTSEPAPVPEKTEAPAEETKKPEEKTSAEEKPESPKEEGNSPAEKPDQPRKSNNSSHNRKKKKRKKSSK